MLSVEDAITRILANINPLDVVLSPLSEVAGTILAEDIIAREDLPPFANSAMDGYAFLSQDDSSSGDQPSRLRIIGEVAAGSIPQISITPGTAVRIMTGAPIPPGADTVLQLELTNSVDESTIDLLQASPPQNNIRPAGEDMRRGEIILQRGTTLRPWEIGLLASMGYAQVPHFRRPRVAVLATGNELVPVDQTLSPGKIRNSNSALLLAAVREAGAEAIDLGIAHDDRESLLAKFHEASERADLILTSGGVSVGAYDLVKALMDELGEVDFWRINMKPGKPVAFGHLANIPLLGLPGNPVSAAVTFTLLGRPLIRKLGGHTRLQKPTMTVSLQEGLKNKSLRRHYVRAIVEWDQGQLIARSTGNQGSHLLTSLRQANALLIIPEGVILAPEQHIKAIMLDWPEI